MNAAYRETFGGRVALVTGSSRGIGAEVARLLGEAGATVVLTARSEADLEAQAAVVRQTGARCLWFAADLRMSEEVDALADFVLESCGGVDVLVHNAGHSIRRNMGAALDRAHDFERLMRLNYHAPVALSLRLLPSLRERGGLVSMVLTMGVVIPGPFFPAYHASKSALGVFGDAMAAEFAHDGVFVSNAYLPLVQTKMMSPTKAYAKRNDLMTATDAAIEVLDGLVYRRRRVISPLGHVYAVANHFAPALTTRVLNHLSLAFPIQGESRKPRTRRWIKRLIGGAPI